MCHVTPQKNGDLKYETLLRNSSELIWLRIDIDTLVNAVMNLQVPYNAGNLTS
jgi:hypothetical protein